MIISKSITFCFILIIFSVTTSIVGCTQTRSLTVNSKINGNTPTDLSESSGGDFFILRPLNKEVLSLSKKTLTVTYQSQTNRSLPYSISDANTQQVLQSGNLQVSSGKNDVPISFEQNVLSYRGNFLKLTIATESVEFGRGLVFLVAGQSNSVDAECADCLAQNIRFPTDPRVVHLVNDDSMRPPSGDPYSNIDRTGDLPIVNEITRSSFRFDPLPDSSAMLHGVGLNVWNRVGKELSTKYNIPVAFVIIGKGGASSSEWVTPTFLNRFDYGRGFQFDAVLWHQGESDASSTMTKAAYISNIRTVMKSTYAKGITAPWVVAQTSICGAEISPINSYQRMIEEAQLQLISEGKSDGVQQEIVAGPNTNSLPHKCHFDTVSEFDSYAKAWTDNLLNSEVLSTSSKVIGRIDSVSSEGQVFGWACDQNIERSINVHVYIGGPLGAGGVLAGSYPANLTSEVGILSACNVARGNYRFNFTLPESIQKTYSGQSIYIYGISSSNGKNNSLINSGTLKVPVTTSMPDPNQGPIIGYLDTVTLEHDLVKIQGWACAKKYDPAINIQIYYGGPSGSGTILGTYLASSPRELQVATACETSSSGHGFSIVLTAAQSAAVAGKSIYVHGISLNPAFKNDVIAGSGKIAPGKY